MNKVRGIVRIGTYHFSVGGVPDPTMKDHKRNLWYLNVVGGLLVNLIAAVLIEKLR